MWCTRVTEKNTCNGRRRKDKKIEVLQFTLTPPNKMMNVQLPYTYSPDNIQDLPLHQDDVMLFRVVMGYTGVFPTWSFYDPSYLRSIMISECKHV